MFYRAAFLHFPVLIMLPSLWETSLRTHWQKSGRVPDTGTSENSINLKHRRNAAGGAVFNGVCDGHKA
jgi:hypothetical protein